MEEAWGGVKLVALLLGLSGVLLLTNMFWTFPLGFLAYGILFPFFQRLAYVSSPSPSPAWLLSILYGAVQLVIAYGLWVKSRSSRIALISLGVFMIGYAIWDSLAIRQGAYGNSGYYEVSPIVVANAVYYGIVVAYLSFSRNSKAYFAKSARTVTTEMSE